ncbi:Resolvase-like protein [Arcticibacter svalbardensis MN12-7]|uniref:Resolvase-like protein n=1 Tax=Arcticibacter svalbardensis MN12-7 TaxID=1150600 RepID=R9GUL6_9SPHI|nr:Resolvase-like protein [Arcticibacter svalbardensis MN12-7]
MTRTVAYLRVSTIDQYLEKNKADILHLANDKGLSRVEFIKKKFRKSFLEKSKNRTAS